MGRQSSKKRRERQTKKHCVYCGELAICTDEHVIPRCLFPESYRPDNGCYLVIPACRICNGRKSKDDSYVRDWLAIDKASEESELARDLWPTVNRSIEKRWSDFGRSALSSLRYQDIYSKEGIFIGNHLVCDVDWKRIDRFLNCVAKGLIWYEIGERLPDDHSVVVVRIFSSAFPGLVRTLMSKGCHGIFKLGRGVFDCAYVSWDENDLFCTQWLMSFYQRVYFSVTTGPKDVIDPLRRDMIERQGPIF